MTLILFAVLGFVLLCVEIAAVVSNRRFFQQASRLRYQRAFRALLLIIGVALAAGSLFIQYPLSPKIQVFGAPFVSALFQRTEHGWEDFAGPLTMPAMLGNAAIAFLLPQVPLAVARWLRGRPGQAKD
jgi:hypothetical protein